MNDHSFNGYRKMALGSQAARTGGGDVFAAKLQIKRGMVALGLLGICASILLAAHYGFIAIGSAVAVAGWSCLAAMMLFHLVPLTLCGLAWLAQQRPPPARLASYLWFRWTRDAGNDLLGMLPGSGELLGIRAMTVAGIEVVTAIASLIVDLTLELGGQVVFTLLGLALLLLKQPDHALISWTLTGLAFIALPLAAFVLAQRFGFFHLVECLAERLARDRGWIGLKRMTGIHDRIHNLYADHPRIFLSFALHLVAWLIGTGEAGIALYFMGIPMGIASLVVLESLSYALRSAAFFIPAAMGVQEAGYALLGPLFGIPPEYALALSFLKRGRAFALATPGLIVWQMVENGHATWALRRLRLP